jgi:hypothetical protein
MMVVRGQGTRFALARPDRPERLVNGRMWAFGEVEVRSAAR